MKFFTYPNQHAPPFNHRLSSHAKPKHLLRLYREESQHSLWWLL